MLVRIIGLLLVIWLTWRLATKRHAKAATELVKCSACGAFIAKDLAHCRNTGYYCPEHK